jgi:signal transduction histidine kinase
LGLSICKRIVEEHGGTIQAQSVAGQGATFTVVIPMGERMSNKEQGMSNAEVG